MASKRVMLSLDEELVNEWDKVSNKLKMTKSAMVKDFLEGVIPIFDKDDTKSMMRHAMEEMGKGISDLGSLFYEDKKQIK